MKVALTIIFAVFIQMIPVSLHLRWLEPNFIALVMMFWLIYAPGSLNMYAIFVLGLFCDVLFGTMLGEHSFTLLITAYSVYRLLRPLRVWPLWQHFILVFTILLISQISSVLVKMLQGYEFNGAQVVFLSPFLGLVIWPALRNVLFGLTPRSIR